MGKKLSSSFLLPPQLVALVDVTARVIAILRRKRHVVDADTPAHNVAGLVRFRSMPNLTNMKRPWSPTKLQRRQGPVRSIPSFPPLPSWRLIVIRRVKIGSQALRQQPRWSPGCPSQRTGWRGSLPDCSAGGGPLVVPGDLRFYLKSR